MRSRHHQLRRQRQHRLPLGDQLLLAHHLVRMLPVALLIVLASGVSSDQFVPSDSPVSHSCERYCVCPFGSQLSSGSSSRCEPLLTGDPCVTDSQCQANNAHSLCLRGACACEEDHYSDNGVCRNRVALMKPCQHDDDCSARAYNGTCRNGVCTCSIVATSLFQYRLVGGADCSTGQVKVKSGKGPWVSICYNEEASHHAVVVCRSLGFVTGTIIEFPTSGLFSSVSMMCNGQERNVGACFINRAICFTPSQVGVVCV